MKRTLLALGLAAASVTAALPASASSAAAQNIVYTVSASSGNAFHAACVIYADRFTADYGPTTVYAVAESPFGVSTNIRCTVTKGGTTWVDASASGTDRAVIWNERHGTIPAAGVTVCLDADSQLSVDAHPTVHVCRLF